MMEMLKKLKEETRILHEQIEAQNLARRILDHSIDLDTYKLLLCQNYLAYRKTETEIKKIFPNYRDKKHRQLQKDLEQFHVPIPLSCEDEFFKCESKAEALGATYVVEGSALGGLLLAKNISKCQNLAGIEQHYFFNGNKNNLHDWNNFKKALQDYTFTEVEEAEAIAKAKATFRFFGKIFNKKLQIA